MYDRVRKSHALKMPIFLKKSNDMSSGNDLLKWNCHTISRSNTRHQEQRVSTFVQWVRGRGAEGLEEEEVPDWSHLEDIFIL